MNPSHALTPHVTNRTRTDRKELQRPALARQQLLKYLIITTVLFIYFCLVLCGGSKVITVVQAIRSHSCDAVSVIAEKAAL